MSLLEQISEFCKSHQFPESISQEFLHFCQGYEKALAKLHTAFDPAVLIKFLEVVAQQLQQPHQFSIYHQAVRSPIDYYQLGLDFVRPLIDFSRSQLLGEANLLSIEKTCLKKENVILLSNHQTEIDPQIISLLIEKTTPMLAKEMIFVAGHRVTTDPLAIPLSLGRNLLCIFSKRHIKEPPEKTAEKLKHNQQALNILLQLLNEGGKCIYIAPSGGRDRKAQNGQIEVAPFDPDNIEMLSLLARKAKRPTHFHTLALATYDLLPPPDQILSEIGEQRTTNFSPAHLFFGKQIDFLQDDFNHLQDKNQKRKIRATTIWQQVVANYLSFFQK